MSINQFWRYSFRSDKWSSCVGNCLLDTDIVGWSGSANTCLLLRLPTSCRRYAFWSERWSFCAGNYFGAAGIVYSSSLTKPYLLLRWSTSCWSFIFPSGYRSFSLRAIGCRCSYSRVKHFKGQLSIAIGCCRYSFWSEHWSFFVGNYLVDTGIVDWSSWMSNDLCADQLLAEATSSHQVTDPVFFLQATSCRCSCFRQKSLKEQLSRKKVFLFSFLSPFARICFYCFVQSM